MCCIDVQPTVEPGQEVTEMMIPANKVGLVIGEYEYDTTTGGDCSHSLSSFPYISGKGGEMIKALQVSTGNLTSFSTALKLN